MNELEHIDSPIVAERPAGRLVSRGLYNLVLTGLVLVSFAVMAACSYVTSTADFIIYIGNHALAFTIGSVVLSIAGIIAMSVGRAKESLPVSLAGFALFTLTFGFSTSFILSAYSLEAISVAFGATAGIMVVFGAAGFLFPRFFAKIQGVLVTALLAIIVVELVLALMGVHQNILDMVVVLVFCGFIGFDVYQSQAVAPTLNNAVWYAVELYLDVINVFVRLLEIIGDNK